MRVNAATTHLAVSTDHGGKRPTIPTTSEIWQKVLNLPHTDGGNRRGCFDNRNAMPAAARINASRPKTIAVSQPSIAPIHL
jgi:hypothetical protein